MKRVHQTISLTTVHFITQVTAVRPFVTHKIQRDTPKPIPTAELIRQAFPRPGAHWGGEDRHIQCSDILYVMKCSDSRKTVHHALALLKDVSTFQCQPITALSCWTCYFKSIQKGFVNTGIGLIEVVLVWIELIVLVMHLSLKG